MTFFFKKIFVSDSSTNGEFREDELSDQDDVILEETDKNNDGYIDPAEFVLATENK